MARGRKSVYSNPPLTDAQKVQLLSLPEYKYREEFPEHSRTFLREKKRELRETKAGLSIDSRIYISKQERSIKKLNSDYNELIKETEKLKDEREAIIGLDDKFNIRPIKIKKTSRKSESTAVLVFSDWHIEEPVDSEAVNGLNVFNLDIAKLRIDKLAQTSLKLLNGMKDGFRIKNVIIGLLGDFISGTIHDDLQEGNLLLPSDAIWNAQNHIASVINFLLDNTKFDFEIVCATGNHGRMTAKQRVMTEQGNSLELYMYRNLRQRFQDNKRIKFTINPSYHTYVDVYGYTLRFHHGHSIRYGGGVGGIYIPVNKAIAQWNKAKHADYDIFGHFHQQVDGGNFVCNGSLVGYSEYAIKIKAGFDYPKQTFMLIDSDYGKTVVSPIVLREDIK